MCMEHGRFEATSQKRAINVVERYVVVVMALMGWVGH